MVRHDIIIQAASLKKSYTTRSGDVQALQGIDLSIRAGEIVALVGPTGSGKTTLLSLLAGLEPADGGRILLLDNDLSALNHDALTNLRSQAIGFVYQDSNLFDSLTTRENVALPLRLALSPTFNIDARTDALLADFGLTALANRYPPELSGGEQQMVAIARAMAANPRLILADEPTANLDSSAARRIMSRLHALADSGEHGVLFATHDLRMASQAGRILTLRDGAILKETLLGQGASVSEVIAGLV